MAYEDLKAAALKKYGSQDDIPDDVYNSLYKYKTQGQDALNDQEYNILSNLKSNPQASQSSGYAYTSPEQYHDLYNNAKNVGYSGLDAAQKQLFDEAYPKSIYAQQGRSLDEAHQATDRAAGVGQGNFIQDANAGLTAGVQNMGRFLADQQDQSGVNPKAVGYEATPVNWGKAAVNTAAFLVPGAIDYGIAKSTLGPIAKGLLSAVVNGGAEYGREKAVESETSPFTIASSSVLGGLTGGMGGAIAGKARANAIDEVINKANIAEKLDAQRGLVNRLEAGHPLPGTKTLRSPYGIETWESNQRRIPREYVNPQDILNATKEHMASAEYGNKMVPDAIPDLEAAKYLQMQEDKLRELQNTKVTRAPLMENPYDKMSSTNFKDLILNGGIRVPVSTGVGFVNRHQGLVGNVGAVAPGLANALTQPIFRMTNHNSEMP